MYAGLLRALVERGVRVRGVVAGDASIASAPPQVQLFARRDAPLLARLTACRCLVRTVLRDGGIDVVAAHFAPYALPVLDLVRGLPFVFHFHGPWAAESRTERQRGLGLRAKRAIESIVYRRAKRFIVLSRAFGDLLAETYGVARELIDVVPGGVDVERFDIAGTRRDARVALGIPTDRPVIGTVRRLVHRVGVEGLVDAISIARDSLPDVLLLIAGAGPLAAYLAAGAAARGLQENIRFIGFVPDERLPLLYRACDVSVVPSVALEGFGLTTVESLAAGTPVLVTPVGGLPETVEGLDPGLVLPDNRPTSLATALVEALNGTRRLPTPAQCRDYARANFAWRVIADRTLGVYESAATRRP
jgi:glycosyltransferase involved in cell wall biosynthesis